MSGKTRRPSGQWEIPSPMIVSGRLPSIRLSSNSIVPDLRESIPEMLFKVVLFPAPLAPMRVTRPPSCTSSDIPWRTSASHSLRADRLSSALQFLSLTHPCNLTSTGDLGTLSQESEREFSSKGKLWQQSFGKRRSYATNSFANIALIFFTTFSAIKRPFSAELDRAVCKHPEAGSNVRKGENSDTLALSQAPLQESALCGQDVEQSTSSQTFQQSPHAPAPTRQTSLHRISSGSDQKKDCPTSS